MTGVLVLLRVLFTIFVVHLAQRKHRNAKGWGIFAFLFPLIALIAVLLVKGRQMPSVPQTVQTPMFGPPA